MQSKILLMEKKLKYKKIDAHKDETEINKLRLMEKIAKLDNEIVLADATLNDLDHEIKELEAQGE